MKTILITGTTSGIGRSLSKIFAEENYHVILVSRNQEKLLLQQKELQDSNNMIDIVACDLEQQDAAQKIYRIIKENSWSIDLLINNAGFMRR